MNTLTAERKDTFIRVGVTEQMAADLARIRELQGVPVSEFVRRAITERLEQSRVERLSSV